jgi:hypothetical protein
LPNELSNYTNEPKYLKNCHLRCSFSEVLEVVSGVLGVISEVVEVISVVEVVSIAVDPLSIMFKI